MYICEKMNILTAALMALSFNTAVPKIYPDSTIQKYAKTNHSEFLEFNKKYPLVEEKDWARMSLVYYSIKTGGILGFRFWNNSAKGILKTPENLISRLERGDSVDCDENSALLVAILRAQGYDASLFVPFPAHVIVRVQFKYGINLFMDPTLGGFADYDYSVYNYYFAGKDVWKEMGKIDKNYRDHTLSGLDRKAQNVSAEISYSSIHRIVEKINALAELSPELYAAFVCAGGGYYYDLSYDPLADAMKKTYSKEDFEATIKAYSIYFGVDENTLHSLEAVGYTWAVRFMVWLCQYRTPEERTNPAGSLKEFMETYF
ncbi:MAG: hypothetical protein ACPL06_01160 [Candidatus Anstonellales archaeon]